MDRERLERLLREPDNLFGPPTGHGYDYVRAGLVVGALVLATLSGWCLLVVADNPALPRPLAVPLLILAAPFVAGGWPFWPLHMLVGWAASALVWYATLHTAACLTGLRRCGRLSRTFSAVVAVVGWVGGSAVVLWGWAA